MGTNEKNMTTGSPGKLIITFAIPLTTDAWKYFSAVLYDGRYHDRRTGGRG